MFSVSTHAILMAAPCSGDGAELLVHILTRSTSSGDGNGENGPASSFILQMEMLKHREKRQHKQHRRWCWRYPSFVWSPKSASSSDLSGEGHQLFTPLLMCRVLDSTPITGEIYFSLFLNLTGLGLVLTNSCK